VARVKPNLCSAISGRLGGIEFAMAREGIVVKRRKPPRQLNHVKQVEARTVFHQRVADWHAMTPEAMLEWTAYANTHPVTNRLGETRYLSGYNWFLKNRDTEDGILLPLGITPPLTNLQAIVVENTMYEFAMDFPAGCEDNTDVEVMFFRYPFGCDPEWDFGGGTQFIYLTKATIADLDYAHLTALGVVFEANEQYLMRTFIHRPRHYWSNNADLVFTCQPEVLYSFHFKMDDNLPTTLVLNDWAGNAEIFIGPNPNTEDHHVAGVHDGALHFNGASDHIDLTPAFYESYLDVDQPFTLAIWYRPDAPMGVAWQHFLSSYVFNEPHVRFAMRNNESFIYCLSLYLGFKHDVAYHWTEVNNNAWRHFAVVRNGTNVRMFRNGIKALDETHEGYQGAMFKSGNVLSIGSQRGVTLWAKGAADDVYLFNYALTDAEVAALAVP
jgi:hypothetical protein